MTTHEAIALQPQTIVRWIPPKGYVPGNYSGIASPTTNNNIRIVWDDIAEPDTLIYSTDRRMLASLEICEPTTEQNL